MKLWHLFGNAVAWGATPALGFLESRAALFWFAVLMVGLNATAVWLETRRTNVTRYDPPPDRDYRSF